MTTVRVVWLFAPMPNFRTEIRFREIRQLKNAGLGGLFDFFLVKQFVHFFLGIRRSCNKK